MTHERNVPTSNRHEASLELSPHLRAACTIASGRVVPAAACGGGMCLHFLLLLLCVGLVMKSGTPTLAVLVREERRHPGVAHSERQLSNWCAHLLLISCLLSVVASGDPHEPFRGEASCGWSRDRSAITTPLS